jgi:hypothetical protein
MSTLEVKMDLTDEIIAQAGPRADGRRIIWDCAQTGFGVRITSCGKKSFVQVKRQGPKVRWITLGRFPFIKVDEARRMGCEVVRRMENGLSPKPRQGRRGPVGAEFVYVIVAPDRVKIGVSINPHARVKQLDGGGGWGGTLRLHWSKQFLPGEARRVEAQIKRVHAESRIVGEWYGFSPEEAVRVVEAA